MPTANGWLARNIGVPDVASWICLGVIRFWVTDESPHQESSMALADRLVAFFTAMAQFQGLDEGIALLKYLVNVGVLPLDKVPFVGEYFRTESDGQ